MVLEDRTVLVTGASSGIGEACAHAFARAGARLLLCARREERLRPVAFTLHSRYGVPVHHFALDVRDARAVEQAFDALPGPWRAVDILVNNAGKAKGRAPVHEALEEHIEEMIDTNVKGLLYVTRAVLPGMLERGSGHVINIGSTAGRWIYPGGAVYCATKAAVYAISEGLKMDLHGTGIRVSTVDPGLVETEFSLVRFDGDEAAAGEVYADMTPLTAEDVAESVLFCATRPGHVNVSQVMMLPTDQSSSSMVHRRPSP
jgi:NADP-dependent 3-hydroxy acid dehydrogenase YdfG